MANGRIRNNAIRASSVWDRYHAAWRARLNVKRQAGYKTSSFLHLFVFFLNQQPYRLFSSWPKPLYQSEARCTTIHMFPRFPRFPRFRESVFDVISSNYIFRFQKIQKDCNIIKIFCPLKTEIARLLGFRPNLLRLKNFKEVKTNQKEARIVKTGEDEKDHETTHWYRHISSAFFLYFTITFVCISNSYRGAWSSRINDRLQWLEVCFKRPKKIVAIASQGRQDMNQWVTRYRLTFSMDKTHYVYYKQLGVTKVCACFQQCMC